MKEPADQPMLKAALGDTCPRCRGRLKVHSSFQSFAL